jgi:hypothetical protein
VIGLVLATSAYGATWHLVDAQVVDAVGTWPSVWSGTVAYLHHASGEIMYYDGTTAVQIYPAALQNYEPAIANGVIAWRNCQVGPGSNEILRWNGQATIDISNSPDVVDGDVAIGSNGDVIWVRDNAWLMYYSAAQNATVDLSTRGAGPSLYIRPDGVATYAYQSPDTFEIFYFDGTSTQLIGLGLGEGTSRVGRPSLWDGAIAFIGPGVGDSFTAGEVFYWKAGQTTRITNDDALGGRADDYPSLWNDVIVWQRAPASAFQTRIELWDGVAISELTSTRSLFPSFHDRWVAYSDSALGLILARVIPELAGDCNQDGVVDGEDFLIIAGCVTGPGNGPVDDTCACGDLDGDTDVDLADFAALQNAPVGNVLRGDLNCDGTVGFGDINAFVLRLSSPAAYAAEFPGCPNANGDINMDGVVDFADINAFVAQLSGL